MHAHTAAVTALSATGQTIDWLVPVAIVAGVLVVAGLVVVIVRAVRSRRSDAS